MQDEAKRQIGDYEILERLGAGAMGEVYKVRNTISDRVEAMKIMLPSLAGNKQLDDRFRREIKLVASLNHPHIASLCTALTIGGQFVMVMEFVEGVTIESLLRAGPIPVPETLDYIDQAADALGFAHKRGIIHRDIKPANFMLMHTGAVKLMDFGIARGDSDQRITQTGATMGTFHYMSPEQIMGQPTDARSDLYSLGISLYEMATGIVPYRSDSGYKILSAHLNDTPQRPIELQPHLPMQLNEIILKLIAKKPEDRFQSAEELRAALKTVGSTAFEMPVAQPARTATVLEQPSAFHPPTTGRGSTEYMNPGAVAPDFRKVTPVPMAGKNAPMAAKKIWSAPRSMVAGLAFLVVGGVAAATYVARSPKTQEKAVASATPAPQNSTPPPVKPVPVPRTPNGTSLPKGPNAELTAGAAADAKARQLAAAGGAGVRGGPAIPGKTTMAANGTLVIGGAGGGGVSPALTPEEKDRLDVIDHELVGYESRRDAYNNRLNGMQEQMRRQGLSLRTDIVTAQQSMNNNLYRAKQSLRRNDAKNAEEFAGQAKSDMDTIESFLHPK